MERICAARRSTDGQPCRKAPIRGGTVCATHGGSTRHIKRGAEDRIREMVDPALNQLLRIVESGDSDAVRLAAVKDVLDRAGYKPVEKREHAGEVIVRQYVGIPIEDV